MRLLEIQLRHVQEPSERRTLFDRLATLHASDREDAAAAMDVSRAAEEFLSEGALLEQFERLAKAEGALEQAAARLTALAERRRSGHAPWGAREGRPHP